MNVSGYKRGLSVGIYFFHVQQLLGYSVGGFHAAKTL